MELNSMITPVKWTVSIVRRLWAWRREKQMRQILADLRTAKWESTNKANAIRFNPRSKNFAVLEEMVKRGWLRRDPLGDYMLP